MGARKTVRFYYSIGSRYSYLASTQLEALEHETGCEVVWRPLHSVELYRLRGINPLEGEPVSGQYDWDYRCRDAERWAEFYGVPYEEPRGVVDFDPRHWQVREERDFAGEGSLDTPLTCTLKGPLDECCEIPWRRESARTGTLRLDQPTYEGLLVSRILSPFRSTGFTI